MIDPGARFTVAGLLSLAAVSFFVESMSVHRRGIVAMMRLLALMSAMGAVATLFFEVSK